MLTRAGPDRVVASGVFTRTLGSGLCKARLILSLVLGWQQGHAWVCFPVSDKDRVPMLRTLVTRVIIVTWEMVFRSHLLFHWCEKAL